MLLVVKLSTESMSVNDNDDMTPDNDQDKVEHARKQRINMNTCNKCKHASVL